MAWDDEQKGNPWNSGGQGGPSDLDEIVRNLQRKLSGILGGGRRGGGSKMGRGMSSIGAGGLVAVLAVWCLSGFYQIDDAERGIELRFGKYTSTTLPGLRWHLPWPIETVEKINTNVTERFPYQGSMLTKDEAIVLVDLVVQYRREDPRTYLFTLRDPEDTLRDVTRSAIREVVGKNELDYILTEGREDIAAQTQELVQSTLDLYGTGIRVDEVNLQEANFPRDVEASVQDAIKAREDKERMGFEADAYANDIVPRARGAAARQLQDAQAYRARVIADSDGEADRFLQILTEYEKAPEVTRQRLYLETLEHIMAGSTKVLLDAEGGGNLIYLPLDRLMDRRSGGVQAGPMAPGPVDDFNSRTAASRERDIR
ncbi:MAG: FtsH protease activity modulator HflK [Gammaproteobacteria bacterium]